MDIASKDPESVVSWKSPIILADGAKPEKTAEQRSGDPFVSWPPEGITSEYLPEQANLDKDKQAMR